MVTGHIEGGKMLHIKINEDHGNITRKRQSDVFNKRLNRTVLWILEDLSCKGLLQLKLTGRNSTVRSLPRSLTPLVSLVLPASCNDICRSHLRPSVSDGHWSCHMRLNVNVFYISREVVTGQNYGGFGGVSGVVDLFSPLRDGFFTLLLLHLFFLLSSCQPSNA